jgi:centromere protein I
MLQQWTASLLSQPDRSPADSQSISDLINHSNFLALTILQNSLSVSTCSRVLNFYESTASLISLPTLRATVRITTPPAELIYTLYFTNSLSTLSRLCYILALYKRAFELAMSSKPSVPATEQLSYPKEYVNHFNGFLMDICNCIWRSRAFNTSDVNALGCLLPASVVALLSKYVSNLDTSIALQTLFSLSFSPLFGLQAISYVRELEDKEVEDIEIRHAGPVTQASLKQLEKDGGLKLSWADYRLGVLRYLENKGVMGVGELMYNTMKHLMTARENMA